jgi:hypothetical protein
MSKNNPLNFGSLIGSAATSITGGLDPFRSFSQYAQQFAPQNSGSNTADMFGGTSGNLARMALMEQQQVQAQKNVGGGVGPSGSDPNNSTGVSSYAINPNANISGALGVQDNAVTNASVDAPLPQEGNFNPTTEEAAANIFGNSQQFKPKRKLINL